MTIEEWQSLPHAAANNPQVGYKFVTSYLCECDLQPHVGDRVSFFEIVDADLNHFKAQLKTDILTP